ncbi:pilus assembly protein [Oceanimonas sp. NS1]|nr:pilus assembly protein [Oceanimonas sp. NS1]
MAIEFAVLFTLFFTLVYGILAYSLPLLLEISFRQLSSEAARAILKVDPAAKNYSELLSREVTLSINNSWLPAAWRTGDAKRPIPGITGSHYRPLKAILFLAM